MTIDPDISNEFLARLKSIFSAMDEAYERAAGGYGFVCTGCDDNCCMTRFYHHTHLEYAYLMEGMRAFGLVEQKTFQEKALDVVERTRAADQKGGAVRIMCPLNLDGLCSLYAHRPMICRLHGIPHELRPPGRSAERGPGCGAFLIRCGEMNYITFDRTPFYMEMARLEKEFKQRLNKTRKFKKTIAEMLVENIKE